MIWRIQLTGDPGDLDELSKVYDDGEIRIMKDDDSYFLESKRFKQFTTDEEVRKYTNDLLSTINGSMKFVLKSRRPVEINSVIQITDDGKIKRKAFVTASLGFRATVSATIRNPDGTVIYNHPAEKVKFQQELAEKDPKVKAMIDQILHDSETATGLYNIWDMLKEDVKNVPKRGWCTTKEENKLTQTLNSREALGVHARHGHHKVTLRDDPFTLKEAKPFVLGVVDQWFQYRYKILNQTEKKENE